MCFKKYSKVKQEKIFLWYNLLRLLKAIVTMYYKKSNDMKELNDLSDNILKSIDIPIAINFPNDSDEKMREYFENTF